MDNTDNNKILNFINQYDDTLTQICIKARNEHGLGLLVVDISNNEINKEKCNTHYFPINDIPETLDDFKKRLLDNPAKDRTIFYVISYNNISKVIEKLL